jgi:hypothetical protein
MRADRPGEAAKYRLNGDRSNYMRNAVNQAEESLFPPRVLRDHVPLADARTGSNMERSFYVSRLILGTAYLTWSALAARRQRQPAPLRTVAGILGARHLAQGLLTADRPTRAALALGAEVDAAHSASMIVLGTLFRRWRTAAFTDALVAGVFAAAGVAWARRLPGGEPASNKAGTLEGWRDGCAESLASYLAPSWLSGA